MTATTLTAPVMPFISELLRATSAMSLSLVDAGPGGWPPARVVTPNIQPDWLVQTHRAMGRIARLKSGWDGQGSVPVPTSLIYLADRIIRDALAGVIAPVAPFVVPGGDGSLQIEW